ncbi:metalloprotease-like protein [Amycolatopsis magusensis]|uniref:metalloprotease-like protein n=1 Tax=Amycolatopsis magusensis TaxID=882444 RepID=UPI0037B25292
MRTPATLIALVLAVVSLAACGTPVRGTAVRSPAVIAEDLARSAKSVVAPDFVNGSDGGDVDRLAATAITDIQAYWAETYPSLFGGPWEDLRGGFYSVDTADAGAEPPPCTESAATISGNAYYCSNGDVIVWDRAALLPVLTERFGGGGVLLVLAHEMGHAVQQRTGLGRGGDRDSAALYPGIVIEAMADCYAGSFIRWVVDGKAEHLQVEREELDSLMRALITFRDPLGTSHREASAHGDAFDRVSAFQDGFESGPRLCADITASNRAFTQRSFLSEEDAARGGNLPLPDLVPAISEDLGSYFSREMTQAGHEWSTPKIEPVTADPRCTAGEQGAVAFCPEQNSVQLREDGTLGDIHTNIGDFATGTVLASRFGLSALAAAGKPTTGEPAQRGTLCLAGAYTGSLLNPQGEFTVSPGDLDEAVQVLLGYDYPARDVDGGSIASGFDRVSAFRGGVVGGTKACDLG